MTSPFARTARALQRAWGFAAIAYPAEYENSGVMTFLIGQDGVVYESDLGPDTTTIAGAIDAYDPDRRWTIVE